MASSPAAWIRDARQYLSEVQSEYKKITWPPQKEAVAGTVGVLVFVAIVTTVMAFIDFGLSRVMSLVLQ